MYTRTFRSVMACMVSFKWLYLKQMESKELNLHYVFLENTYVLLLLTQARVTTIFVLNLFQILIKLEDYQKVRIMILSQNSMTPSKFALAAMWKCLCGSADKCSR